MFSCEIAIQKGLCHSDCCGIVPIPKDLWYRVKHRYTAIEAEIQEINDEVYIIPKNGIKCVFLDISLKCGIYDERPEVCRQYGLIDKLPCPFIKRSGRLRSPADMRKTQRRINHEVDDKLKRMGVI